MRVALRAGASHFCCAAVSAAKRLAAETAALPGSTYVPCGEPGGVPARCAQSRATCASGRLDPNGDAADTGAAQQRGIARADGGRTPTVVSLPRFQPLHRDLLCHHQLPEDGGRLRTDRLRVWRGHGAAERALRRGHILTQHALLLAGCAL